MAEFMNEKNGQRYQSIPVVVFYDKDLRYLYHYIELPAIYHKDAVRGHQQGARAGESTQQAHDRGMKEFAAMQASPFFDLWASAAIDEILSAIYQKRVLAG